MHWQDTVLACSSLVFIVSLIPTLVGSAKPALSTSIINAVMLTGIAAVYLSLSLWVSTVLTLLTGVLWAALAIQSGCKQQWWNWQTR